MSDAGHKHAVLPTIRPERLRSFLEAWGDAGGWDVLHVMFDLDEVPVIEWPTGLGYEVFAYSHSNVAAAGMRECISRRDSACRSFGFYQAVRAGAWSILSIDDDCLPAGQTAEATLFDAHLERMSRPVWIDTCDDIRPRGRPYGQLAITLRQEVNVGLWHGTPDLDAVSQLAGVAPASGYTAAQATRIVPAGAYVSMCGMNLCFTRLVAPLMWFTLQGERQPYRRFDDIWAGVIAKRVMDHLGLRMSYGGPCVDHTRASDPLANLVAEAQGIRDHADFVRVVHNVQLKGSHWSPLMCLARIATAFRDDHADLEEPLRSWLHAAGDALELWVARWQEIMP